MLSLAVRDGLPEMFREGHALADLNEVLGTLDLRPMSCPALPEVAYLVGCRARDGGAILAP